MKNSTNLKDTKQKDALNIRWMLVGYDLIVYAIVASILLAAYGGTDKLSSTGILQQVCLSAVCIFAVRLLGKIYGQVWRYGGIQCYIRLLFTDAIAFLVYLCLELLLPIQKITFARMLSLVSLNLLGALALRMMYRYAYKCGNQETAKGKFLSLLLHLFSGVDAGNKKEVQKIKVAIIGAGRVGVSLAEELLNNEEAAYVPRCFIDIKKEKVGRDIHGIPVWSEDEATFNRLGEFEVQEIIFAIPSMDADKKKALYEYYRSAGYKLKVYDYPTMYAVGGKRHLREFDIEELLFRKPLAVSDEHTNEYYKGKVVLITGGGGSIGSELCRQLAKMNPKKIIILDIYENGAYDVQQELKIAYGNRLDLQIEICSITHRKALVLGLVVIVPDDVAASIIAAVCLFVMLTKLYPDKRRAIVNILLLAASLFFIYVFFGKAFSGEAKITDSFSLLSRRLNAYFSGFVNMAASLDMKAPDKLTYFAGDFLRSFPVIKGFFVNMPTTTELFNSALGYDVIYNSQIIPLEGQAYFYFNFIGVIIAPIIVTKICVYFYNKMLCSSSTYEYFIYCFYSLLFAFGLVMYDNFLMLYLFLSYVPLYLIGIFIKRRRRDERVNLS